MCDIDGCTQQTLSGSLCYFHQKVADGLIISEMTPKVVTPKARELFDKYHTLRVGIVHRFFRTSPSVAARFEVADLLQLCHNVMWEWLVNNNIEDVGFPTSYLQRLCLFTMISYVRHENYLDLVPLTSITENYIEHPALSEMLPMHEDLVLKRIAKLVKKLTKIERIVFYYHVYPTTYKPRSLRWLSKKLDIPLTTLHRVKKKLLRKFRKGVR